MRLAITIACLSAASAWAATVAAAPWPGGTPVNVTPSGFGNNLSGAVWNPLTRTLWTVENSPGIVRKSVYDTVAATWSVSQSWQPGSDLEAIAIRDYADASIFIGVERDANNHRLIREYSTTTFTLLRAWNLVAMRTGPANDGLEALAFVPDSALAAMHFVDADGDLYESSQFGSGGLFFAGHQDTGEIFVFDLDRNGGGTARPHVHVRTISTGQSEIASLEFDRSNGLLYAWHDDTIDKLQVFRGSSGHFSSLALFDNPFCCDWNIEGIALVGDASCSQGGRRLLFTRDQALSTDPSLYSDSQFQCDCNGNAVADAIDIASHTSSDQDGNGVPDECQPVVVPSDVAEGAPLRLRPRLHGNLPNPFNPQTRVALELPEAIHVHLAVYDVAGRKVRTLADGILTAGRHSVPWDGRDDRGDGLGSGVYWCRMRAGDTIATTRMVCVR